MLEKSRGRNEGWDCPEQAQTGFVRAVSEGGRALPLGGAGNCSSHSICLRSGGEQAEAARLCKFTSSSPSEGGVGTQGHDVLTALALVFR